MSDELFSSQVKILTDDGLCENKKLSDEIRRLDWMKLID